ncbi:hypothetical protein ONZ45_g7437 [Pleurotus djamor]|nr:hypothetical protein ONZ45_g7437 [Pleurotus djamor]
MRQLPATLQLPTGSSDLVDFVIPKFHLYGHGTSCQLRYSVNLLPGCAHSDLEDPERWWAHINPVSMSTKLMSPWSRQETIDDHAQGWNWRKTIQMGSTLLQGLKQAIEMKARHTALHAQFTESFPRNIIQGWEAEVTAWERDTSQPNPFDDSSAIDDNMAAVRLELTQEERSELTPTSLETGPVEFLCAGFDIEEKQRALSALVRENGTVMQEATLQEQRNTLLRRILAWREIQRLHMPLVALDILPEAQFSSDAPESIPLFFTFGGMLLVTNVPSISASVEGLRLKEARLRIGQANDSLKELRRLLRITMGMWDYKFTEVGFSQKGNTRSRAMINRFRTKVLRVAKRYRAARKALLALDPSSPSLIYLKPLLQEDVRCPQRDNRPFDKRSDDQPSESYREISWIWLTVASGSEGIERPLEQIQPISEDDVTDCLKAEWAQSRARAHRWTEEQDLVVEEMRRVLAWLRWRCTWWKSQGPLQSEAITPDLAEGLIAYAEKQTSILTSLHCRFLKMWRPQLQSYHLGEEWLGTEAVEDAELPPSPMANLD